MTSFVQTSARQVGGAVLFVKMPMKARGSEALITVRINDAGYFGLGSMKIVDRGLYVTS